MDARSAPPCFRSRLMLVTALATSVMAAPGARIKIEDWPTLAGM
jgi:hypothetical protein